MADQITRSIELKAALSPDYQAAFKAASDQARQLAGELKQLQKQEDDVRKLQALGAKQAQATADGDAKAAKKAGDAYAQLAQKLGMTGKSSADLDKELQRLGAQTAKLREQKKALDSSAEANRAAQAVQRLQTAYSKLKTPALAKQLQDAKARAKGLGIEVGTNDAKGLRGIFSRFTGNLRQNVQSMMQSNPAVSSLSRAFGGLSLPIAGAVGAVAGLVAGLKKAREALTETAMDTIKAGDEIAKESRALGISAESFQELTYAMERGGASADGFRRSIRRVAEMADEARDGSKTAIENFKKFGVSVEDLKHKNVEELFLQIADGIKAMEDPTDQMRASSQLFGREGYRVVQALSVGSDGLADLRKEARDTGNVLSEDYLKSAEAGADAALEFSARLEGFKKQMGQAATPGQIRRLEALNKAFEDNKESIKTLTEIAGGFAEFTDDLVVGAIEAASAAIQIWDYGTKNLGDSIYKFNHELLPEFFGWVGEKLSAGMDAFTGAIDDGCAVLGKFHDDYIKPVIDAIGQFFKDLMNFPHNIKEFFVGGINSALDSVTGSINSFLAGAKDLPLIGDLISGDPIEAPRIAASDSLYSAAERARLDQLFEQARSGGQFSVNITNQIDARGAAPGAAADVSRAVSSSAQSAYSSLESALSESAYISYAR